MAPQQKDFYYWEKNNLYLDVYLQTRANKNAIIGAHDGRLKISITAPAIENKANRHLIKYLAEIFGVAKSKVKILQGMHSRNKLVCVTNPSALPKNFIRTHI
jgi:hypothetical protein